MNGAKTQHAARWIASSVVSIAIAITAASCGADSGVALSEAGARGKQISSSSGCAGCHGGEGQGGVGPKWQGLAGADIELVDGTIVVADDAYLVRSIKEPGADLLADYAVQMPRNNLSDSEIADVIAYIDDLSAQNAGEG